MEMDPPPESFGLHPGSPGAVGEAVSVPNAYCKRQVCPALFAGRPAGAAAERPQISDGVAAGASQRSSKPSTAHGVPQVVLIRPPSMT
jgi:hypothetical protein